MRCYRELTADDLYLVNIKQQTIELQNSQDFKELLHVAILEVKANPALMEAVLVAMFHAGMTVGMDMERQDLPEQ